jgi:hypothetical protein
MKIFVIINVARQLNGDMVFVKIEKAFISALKAQEYFEKIENNTTELVQNSSGFSVECNCLRSIYEIDVE